MRVPIGVRILAVAAALAALGGLAWLTRPEHSHDPGAPDLGGAGAPGAPLAHAPLARGAAGSGAGGAAAAAPKGAFAGKVVLDPPDSPVPADLVVLVRPSRFHVGSEGAIAKEVPSDGKLGFRAGELPFGAYELRAHASDFTGTPVEVQLSEAIPYAFVTLKATRRADVAGFVRDATKAPLDRARVSLQGASDRGAPVALETKTAADGSFRFERIEDGRYTIVVGFPNVPLRSPLEIEVRGGKSPLLLLEVPRLCGIDVRVAVPGIDAPVEGFAVSCVRTELDRGGEVESALTDAEGRVSFRNLPPGRYALRAAREFFRRAEGRAVLADGIIEKVRIEAVPVLDEILDSLNPNPKGEDR